MAVLSLSNDEVEFLPEHQGDGGERKDWRDTHIDMETLQLLVSISI